MRECLAGLQTPVSPHEAMFVASIRSGVSVVDGLVGGMMVEVMLDSVPRYRSLVRHDIAKRFNGTMRYAKANAGLGRRRRASHCELRQGGSEAKHH